MIDRLFELMDRLVFAAELLAKAVAEAGTPGLTKVKNEQFTPEEIAKLQERKQPAAVINLIKPIGSGVNYADIAARGAAGRDILLTLCRERGINVPARTRTDTLIKNLTAWDLANPVTTEPGQGLHDDSGPAEKDPFADAKAESDADPFGAGADEPRIYTAEEVRGALQKVMAEKNKTVVIALLRNHGGVEKLKDLPEDKYSAVMEAISG